MKQDRFPKQVAIVFAVTVALYLAIFYGIEHVRSRKGPWEVTFTHDAAGAPTLVISQPKLNVHDLKIVFPGEQSAGFSGTRKVVFATPQPVPYEVPFGRCVFEDLTFLPGTVTLHLFGHEIELIPRVLTLDKREHPWASGATLSLSATNKLPSLMREKR